jgi:hypothetical protein
MRRAALALLAAAVVALSWGGDWAEASAPPPQAHAAKTDGAWKYILTVAGGFWWNEFTDYCHFNDFKRIRGSRQFDGRILRTRYFRNPFSARCLRSGPSVQVGTGSVWRVRKNVLKLYFVFTGRVTVETYRLIAYSPAHDRLLVSQSGAGRQYWWGCNSVYNPFDCL